nr:nucleotidyl transferase AbiEii/AbiGii toxin family protein [Xenorhabdus aichiensis]
MKTLFSLPDAPPMAFKGGTSLSKVFNVISRLSEDIDITLDYQYFADGFDPFATSQSRNKIKKFTDRLKRHIFQYANDVVIPYIRSELNNLPTAALHSIRIDESGEKIWVSYPSATEQPDEYLKSEVLIELGGRNVIEPNEFHVVKPYVSEVVTDLEFPVEQVVVLSPERTFWEKATLIHVECHRGVRESADRLSRHWYDLVMLFQHDIGKKAIRNRELLEDVIKLKSVFFNARYANYEECLDKRLLLLPHDKGLTALRADYQDMLSSEMIYGLPLTFEEIVGSIQQIERQINS